MFVLHKKIISQEYLIAAGTKGSVKTQISRQLKTSNAHPEIKSIELLKISSDREIISSLKSNAKILINTKDNQNTRIVKDEKSFLRTILVEFVKCHSCQPENCLVCRECGLVIKKDDNKVLGHISGKQVNELLEIRKDWACDECRIEFVVFAFTNKEKRKEYLKLEMNRKAKEEKYNNLIKTCLNVEVIVSVSPLYEDVNVAKYIQDNMTLDKAVNDKYFQQTAIELFIDFYKKIKKVEINSQRICVKCGSIYINADKDSIGFISQDIYEVETILGKSTGWICEKCGTRSLTLFTFNGPFDNHGYYIDFNIKNQKEINSNRDLINMIPSLELFTEKITSTALAEKLSMIKKFTRNKNKTIASLLNKEVLNNILKIFLNAISEEKYSYKICNSCHHVLDKNNEELGCFWVNNNEDLEPEFKSNYKCSFHQIKNIIYWNMTGWNTLENIEESKIHIFDNADITCLIETYLTPNTNIILPEFLKSRIHFNMPAEKSERGRGSGGLKLLIGKNIRCKQNRLMFSNKGIFVKIMLEDECFIIGAVYWRPEPREESLDDWIKELDNFINIHQTQKRDTKFIIGGDFNARIGANDKKEQTLGNETGLKQVRKSTDTIHNKRGRLLLEMMKKHNFILCNGRSRSDNPGKYTSHTVNGDSVVDYIWVSSNCTKIVRDFAVIDIETSSASYHRGLSLDLRKTEPG